MRQSVWIVERVEIGVWRGAGHVESTADEAVAVFVVALGGGFLCGVAEWLASADSGVLEGGFSAAHAVGAGTTASSEAVSRG